MTKTAESIARKAHAGQVELYGGHDYIRHVERVVELVTGEDAKAVAWLHDVLEDSDLTHRDLEAAGLPSRVVDAVMLLTRGTETYGDYIQMLVAKRNALALAVKVADLRDHLREETLEKLPASLRRRYERALEKITT